MAFWTYLRTRVMRFNCYVVLCYCVVYPTVHVAVVVIITYFFNFWRGVLGENPSAPPPYKTLDSLRCYFILYQCYMVAYWITCCSYNTTQGIYPIKQTKSKDLSWGWSLFANPWPPIVYPIWLLLLLFLALAAIKFSPVSNFTELHART